MAQTGLVTLSIAAFPNGKDNTNLRQILNGLAAIGSAGTLAAGTAGPITAYSITTNVITLTAVNSLTTGGGQQVRLSGFATSTFLNGVDLTVTSATGTTIVAAFTHANASATEASAFTLSPQYLTNGLPVTWKFTNSAGFAEIVTFSATVPSWADFITKVGASPLLTYWYDYTHNTLRIASAGTELTTTTAIPVDTIGFKVEFPKNY